MSSRIRGTPVQDIRSDIKTQRFPLPFSLSFSLRKSHPSFSSSFKELAAVFFIKIIHGGCQVNGPKVAEFLDR